MTHPERAVLDEIDALVDEELRAESSGYDHNLNQPCCPLCNDEWHGIATPWGCPGAHATAEQIAAYEERRDAPYVPARLGSAWITIPGTPTWPEIPPEHQFPRPPHAYVYAANRMAALLNQMFASIEPLDVSVWLTGDAIPHDPIPTSEEIPW